MSNYGGAGLILLSPDRESVLLVCDIRSKKWGFPKGHREKEDADPIATATRECLEETGIAPSSYVIHGHPFRLAKSSGAYIFFYATANTATLTVTPQASEIETIAWVPIADLIANPTHGNKYLRVWIEDMSSGSKRKSTALYRDLRLVSSEPPRSPHVVAHA